MIQLPYFNEKNFFDSKENSASRVILIPDSTETAFDAYCALFEKNTAVRKEMCRNGVRLFAAYKYEGDGIFISFFRNTGELQIVHEQNTNYFDFEDITGRCTVTPQITQVHLEDFGMSYAVRLSDGRFIVIDGGREFEPDADSLYACLKAGSPHKVPVIAAWIMSHPHSDHFHCFFSFIDKYADKITIEKFIFNFPDSDDREHYPKLCPDDAEARKISGSVMIPKFYEYIGRLGVPIYTPHTGQSFTVGDASLDILASMDDTIHCSHNINASSLVIRMLLAGQSVLWATDASFSDARLAERYGDTLRSDILQVPHHGFGCGTVEGQIAAYECIRPDICLLPVIDYHAYSSFDAFKEGSRYLMTRMNVKEMITGDKTRTITIPYAARSIGARELYENYHTGLDDAGARTWVFTNLCTANADDFVYSLLNMTSAVANVCIELYFEERANNVMSIKTEVAARQINTLNITDKNAVESETDYYNPQSLDKVGIPENAMFAVRFMSDIPIVVSHKTHTPSYRSTVNK